MKGGIKMGTEEEKAYIEGYRSAQEDRESGNFGEVGESFSRTLKDAIISPSDEELSRRKGYDQGASDAVWGIKKY